MKKFLTIILSAILTLGMCFGFVGCDWDNPFGMKAPKRTVVCYGIVQTFEETGDLVVFIPSSKLTNTAVPTSTIDYSYDLFTADGFYEIPEYEEDIVLKENDLIELTFFVDVQILETYPMRFSQKPLKCEVKKENVGLEKDENNYILTLDYTKKLQEEFSEFQLVVGDRVQFFQIGGTYVIGNEYMNATIHNIVEQRLSLCLCLGEYSIQHFLRDYADNRLEVVTEMYDHPLYTETKEISYEKYVAANEKYFNANDCYVIDSYDEYVSFYTDVIGADLPLDKEMGNKKFKNLVMFCYARAVSYSRDFIPIESTYLYTSNKIIKKTIYQPESDIAFPAVVVACCIDFVEVPKFIVEKLNEN